MKQSDSNGDVGVDAVDPLAATLSSRLYDHPFKDTIHVSGATAGSIDISFRRTLRVPDGQDSSMLPPDLGSFPLFPVTKFRKTLPKNMAMKGGLLIPMYRKSICFPQQTPLTLRRA